MKKGFMEYKEETEHGDTWIPIQRYRCYLPQNFRELSLHWHEEMEIGYMEEGSLVYTIDLQPVVVDRSDLVLISPQALHAARLEQEDGAVSESLVFHMDLIGASVPDACSIRYLAPILSGSYRFCPVIKAGMSGHEEILACFKELLACLPLEAGAHPGGIGHAREESLLLLKELLFRLLRLLYQNGYVRGEGEPAGAVQGEKKLKSVLKYIGEHYAEPIAVSTLAEVCHFSQPYFMSFFKKNVGMTCVTYLNHYRLTKAAEKLTGTSESVTGIALENGFSNVSYFNKLFRREYGCTPREYRRQAYDAAGSVQGTVPPVRSGAD